MTVIKFSINTLNFIKIKQRIIVFTK